MGFLKLSYLGNSVQHWLIALGASLVALLLLGMLRKFLGRHLAKLAAQTRTRLDDDVVKMLNSTRGWFLLVLSLFLGSRLLTLPPGIERIASSIITIALFIQAGLWAGIVLTASLDRYRQRQMKQDPASVTTLNAIGFAGRLVLWSVILLLALDNLGINVTAMIAGLGVGGIAVALAVQNILGDLLSALSIMLDKPFAIGDFLIVDDYMGGVEYIGLKTTRVRSLSGEQLIFSNSDLLKSRIRNYGRMFERRVVFSIGVTYQTPREKLRQIPVMLREAVEARQKIRFDRAHFKEYGSFSLNFETVYYVLGPDYNLYMDIQQAINLHIHERFEQEAIEFAYPTQTLFVAQTAAPATA
jgi:small-conductance mechanosensitive channel